MNKNLFAQTPPMGWNSYDYYDTTNNLWRFYLVYIFIINTLYKLIYYSLLHLRIFQFS